MCALTSRRNLLPPRLAVAFGAAPAHHALAALERVDAGPQTHNPRPTWPCEAAYSSDRSQCYLTNGHACGDSVVSMGDCTALRCAALRCAALRCAALLCSAVQCQSLDHPTQRDRPCMARRRVAYGVVGVVHSAFAEKPHPCASEPRAPPCSPLLPLVLPQAAWRGPMRTRAAACAAPRTCASSMSWCSGRCRCGSQRRLDSAPPYSPHPTC